jgi:hypothetical protein
MQCGASRLLNQQEWLLSTPPRRLAFMYENVRLAIMQNEGGLRRSSATKNFRFLKMACVEAIDG